MYDHQTESLWSQVKRKSVTGPMTETKLEVLPSTLTTWKKWKKRYPGTKVLSLNTGYTRDYSRDPYDNYYQSKKGLFSFFKPGPGEEEKELVAGVMIEKAVKAYPLNILRKKGKVRDHLGNKDILITLDNETDVLTIKDKEGNKIPYITSYWFVWKGIHPQSTIFRP